MKHRGGYVEQLHWQTVSGTFAFTGKSPAMVFVTEICIYNSNIDSIVTYQR